MLPRQIFRSAFRFVGLAVLAVAVSIQAATPAVPQSQPAAATQIAGPIPIGNLGPMTGTMSAFGQSTHKGIQLAVEDRNKAGGILGRNIQLHVADTESSPSRTVQASVNLIQSVNVVAVLGDVSSSGTIAAAPDFQKAKIPLISPTGTNPRVTQMGEYIFRACFADDHQGLLVAKFCVDDLKAKNAAILVDSRNDYSTGLAANFSEEYAKRGGTLVSNEKYQAGGVNFKTQLTAIKNANPEVVFVPGYYNDVPLIVSQARELGITCPFVGGDGWDSPELLRAGNGLEGCFFVNHFDAGDTDEKVVAFVRKYKERFNETPDGNAVLGYDAANMLFQAIENAKSTEGVAIRNALAAIEKLPAITGPITMGKDRNPIKPGVVIEIKGGKFVFRQRIAL